MTNYDESFDPPAPIAKIVLRNIETGKRVKDIFVLYTFLTINCCWGFPLYLQSYVVVVHLLYVHTLFIIIHCQQSDNSMFIHCKGMCLEEMCAQLLIFIYFLYDDNF